MSELQPPIDDGAAILTTGAVGALAVLTFSAVSGTAVNTAQRVVFAWLHCARTFPAKSLTALLTLSICCALAVDE
jgi:hypothetical protein